MTSKLRAREVHLPSELARPPSFSERNKLKLDACHAGAIPNRMPVSSETPSVNASTRRSMPACARRGIFSEGKLVSALVPQIASRSPSRPPPMASIMLSVRSWRNTRARPAPIDARMAISRWRPAARARRRFAALEHAISSRNATAPSTISRTGRMSPTVASISGCSIMPTWPSVSGYCFSSAAPIARVSTSACWNS